MGSQQVQDTLARMRAGIRTHGWVITGVGENNQCSVPDCSHRHDTRHQEPSLYTAGLTERGLPELLIERVPVAAAGEILNGLAVRSVTEPLVPGTLYRLGAAGSFSVSPVPDREARATCKIARVLYGTRLRVLRVDPDWGR